MNPYNFALLLFAFGTFFVGLLIWLKRQDVLGRMYFIFSIFVTIWGIGFSVHWNGNISSETALFAGRLADASAVFIVVTWLHCILFFVERVAKYRRILFLLYAFALIICSFTFSPLFIPKVVPSSGFKYYVQAGPLFHFFTFVFLIFVPFGFYELIRKALLSNRSQRFQFIGFALVTLFGFAPSFLTFLPKYGIPFSQAGVFVMPLYPFLMAYFLIRHRIFDVEQVVQLLQREKLAAIGLIASSINHEIRNPLYIAKSALETFLENKREGIGPEEPEIVSERALKQIARALDVITKLNRFAKPSENRDDGKGPATETLAGRQSASIQEALKNVLDLVSYEFSLDQIKIKNEIPNDLPQIQADPRQLEEILFNLIVNACHAMSAGMKKQSDGSAAPCGGATGGTLEISASRHCEGAKRLKQSQGIGLASAMAGSLPRNDNRIQLTITDTGCGIPPDQAKHLFEPFRTTKGEKGTGLGLYITKQLVERNGGRISVKSKEGEGTKFMLEFFGIKSL